MDVSYCAHDNLRMQIDQPRANLLALIEERQTDLATVSRAIGKNHAYLQQYIKRNTPRYLPEDVREALADHFRTGNPDVFRAPQKNETRRRPASLISPNTADEVQTKGGAGPGLLPSSERETTDEATGHSYGKDPIVGTWQFPDGYLSRSIGVSAGRARIIEVRGDSMVPTLLSGDRVMVDLDQTLPSPPGLFALWDGEGVVIKRVDRVRRSDPPAIEIISDNPRHKPYRGTDEEVRIIGRVVWYARKI